MTPEQQAAFQAGSGVTPATLLLAIAGSVLVLVIVWVIWVTLGSFRAWQDGHGLPRERFTACRVQPGRPGPGIRWFRRIFFLCKKAYA